MAQYIDKDALIAEIERLYKEHSSKEYIDEGGVVLDELEDFLNTLEVKEVDLEKEIQDHIRECLDIKFPTTDIDLIKKDVEYTARKFFELGLKTQKGE